MWCKLWVLLTFLASWASPFSFLLSKMLVRKWIRKVSPLSSLNLGARLPGIMTSSMFLFAAEFIKTDLWSRWAGEFLLSCSASQQLHCKSALSWGSVLEDPLVLSYLQDQLYQYEWCSQLSTLFPVFRLAHNLVGRVP